MSLYCKIFVIVGLLTTHLTALATIEGASSDVARGCDATLKSAAVSLPLVSRKKLAPHAAELISLMVSESQVPVGPHVIDFKKNPYSASFGIAITQSQAEKWLDHANYLSQTGVVTWFDIAAAFDQVMLNVPPRNDYYSALFDQIKSEQLVPKLLEDAKWVLNIDPKVQFISGETLTAYIQAIKSGEDPRKPLMELSDIAQAAHQRGYDDLSTFGLSLIILESRLVDYIFSTGFYDNLIYLTDKGQTYSAKDGYSFKMRRHVRGEDGHFYSLAKIFLSDSAGLKRLVGGWELKEDDSR